MKELENSIKDLEMALQKATNVQVQQILLLTLSSASDALTMMRKAEE